MGYETNYSLTIKGDLKGVDVIDDLRDNFGYAAYCIDKNGETKESGKWYGYETDMREFSEKYPELLFCLEGEGESNKDIWKKYYKNGKSQECKAELIFPEFDETKLS